MMTILSIRSRIPTVKWNILVRVRKFKAMNSMIGLIIIEMITIIIMIMIRWRKNILAIGI